MTAWDDVRDLIDRKAEGELAERASRLDDAERAQVEKELPGYLKTVRVRVGGLAGERHRVIQASGDRRTVARIGPDPWSDLGGWVVSLRVAGAGVLAPAALVAWLDRGDFAPPRWSEHRDTDLLVGVIAGRGADFAADLAVRLALRIRSGTDPVAPLALALLRHTGAKPPLHDPLVVGWLGSETGWTHVRMLGEDSLLDVLLPRLFEADGVGRALRDNRRWGEALVVAADGGRVRRAALLDGCVNRFLLGGTGPDLRFFVRLHEVLDPSAAEIEPRTRDYLRLLPAAPGPVAELALKRVRSLDLDSFQVNDALEALLYRAEVKLVGAGLAWLDETLGRQAGDDLVPALVMALAHASQAVRDRAVRLALKHAGRFGPEARETLGEVTPTLPGEHGARFAEVFGEVKARPIASG